VKLAKSANTSRKSPGSLQEVSRKYFLSCYQTRSIIYSKSAARRAFPPFLDIIAQNIPYHVEY